MLILNYLAGNSDVTLVVVQMVCTITVTHGIFELDEILLTMRSNRIYIYQ